MAKRRYGKRRSTTRRRRTTLKRSYARRPVKKRYPRKLYAKTSIPRGMSNVEEVLAAPHEQYAKGSKARHGIRRAQQGRRYALRQTYLASRAAREPYESLYRRPRIIQPVMDNWTWIKDPDLHYRMNRPKYDKYFKKGLGFVTENLFGLLGKPAGKVARHWSNAAFDMATDWDMKRPFNSGHFVDAATKTASSLITDRLKQGLDKSTKDIRKGIYADEIEDSGDSWDWSFEIYREGLKNQFSPPNRNDWVDTPNIKLIRALEYSTPAKDIPLRATYTGPKGLLDYGIEKTGFSPVKTRQAKDWQQYARLMNGPARRTRTTTELIKELMSSSASDLLNTNTASSTVNGFDLGRGRPVAHAEDLLQMQMRRGVSERGSSYRRGDLGFDI